jgi:hypothetical protein
MTQNSVAKVSDKKNFFYSKFFKVKFWSGKKKKKKKKKKRGS